MTLLINAGQRGALNSMIGKVAQSRDARLWIVGQLVGHAITSTNEITAPEWKAIRNRAYPGCDWSAVIDAGEEPEMDAGFARELAQLARRFEEEVNGQLTLPIEDQKPPTPKRTIPDDAVRAKYDGRCWECEEEYIEGELICKRNGHWVHADTCA